MNITEAVRTQSLLAWACDPAPEAETTSIAIVDARYLADRARHALGAGPTPDQAEAAIRRRLASPRRGQRESEGRLARLAPLLTPCPRPKVEDGWDRCVHAEPWPCRITRAAWIATGANLADSDGVDQHSADPVDAGQP
jgi:hypothetical protein